MAGSRQDWTRRAWLQVAAAGAVQVATAGQRGVKAAGRPWGVQLYTVRNQMKDHAADTLKAIADIGYKEVEVLRAGVADTCRLATSVGLSPVSLHIESPIVTRDWTVYRDMAKAMGMPAPNESYDVNALVADARPLGLKYLVVSYLMPPERDKPGFFESFADAMNKAGEVVKQAGMQLCYHNHGFEFERRPDGRTRLEFLMSRFDRQLVKLELDVFWVSVTGADPVALIGQHTGRIALMHLKDKAAGTPVETNERNVAPTAFKEVGSGSLDFPGILKAAAAAGVEHYFVEQDQTPGDPLASLKTSFAFLQRQA